MAQQPRPRHDPAVDTSWTLQVLPTGAENLIALGSGRKETRTAAAEAATEALVRCVAALGRSGRQEYRLTVGDTPLIVVPGLAENGLVDLVALNDVVDQFALAERFEDGGAR